MTPAPTSSVTAPAAVAVIGYVRFPAARLSEIRPHLKAFIDATYKLDGCIAFDVGEDPYDRGLIRFTELWPDRESLDRHLKAPHVQPWRVAAGACGLMERKFHGYSVTGTWEI